MALVYAKCNGWQMFWNNHLSSILVFLNGRKWYCSTRCEHHTIYVVYNALYMRTSTSCPSLVFANMFWNGNWDGQTVFFCVCTSALIWKSFQCYEIIFGPIRYTNQLNYILACRAATFSSIAVIWNNAVLKLIFKYGKNGYCSEFSEAYIFGNPPIKTIGGMMTWLPRSFRMNYLRAIYHYAMLKNQGASNWCSLSFKQTGEEKKMAGKPPTPRKKPWTLNMKYISVAASTPIDNQCPCLYPKLNVQWCNFVPVPITKYTGRISAKKAAILKEFMENLHWPLSASQVFWNILLQRALERAFCSVVLKYSLCVFSKDCKSSWGVQSTIQIHSYDCSLCPPVLIRVVIRYI